MGRRSKYIFSNLLNSVLFCLYFMVFLLFLGSVGGGVSYAGDGNGVVPADYIIAGNLNHELGQRWLKARGLKDQGEFDQARHQYIMLLETYPDLIEARFEYVQVLYILGRFRETEVALETLLELDPSNLHYKQFLGTLLLDHGQEQQGILLLEEVWHVQQDTVVGELLYHAYTRRGEKEKSLAVLEYLYKQSDDDAGLQEELFVLYIELGDDLNAQNFAPPLGQLNDVSLKRIILAALLHERLGLEHLAADYWQAVLKKQPDYQLAHEKLVAYYTANSREDEALLHNIFLYSASKDDDGRIAGKIGDYYVRISECPQAVFFLKRSLSADAGQVERLRKLAFCYNEIGDSAHAARTFTAYFLLQKNPVVEDRLTAAMVFGAAGMEGEAARQYRQILVQRPGDVEILVALAEVETRRGEFAKALVVWSEVAKRRPRDVTCRIQILSLSEKLGIKDVSSVLAEIHGLDQNNHRVSLLLALAAFQKNNVLQGMQLFQPLAKREFFSADLLALRAEIFRILHQPEQSFNDFSEALKVDLSLAESSVLNMVEVAGILGRLDVLLQLDQQFLFSTSPDLKKVLRYADALAQAGDFVTSIALYNRVTSATDSDLGVFAHRGLAGLYGRYGFKAEAEQENRLNWLKNKDGISLLNLAEGALKHNNNGEAEYWLDQYVLIDGLFNPAVYHAEIRLLMADGDFEQAMALADGFMEACGDAGEECRATGLEIDLDRAMLFHLEGRLTEEAVLVQRLRDQFPEELGPWIYAVQMAKSAGDDPAVAVLLEALFQQGNRDAGELFVLQQMAQDVGLYSVSKTLLRKLHKGHPQSLKYGLALVHSLIKTSSFDEASDVITRLQSIYSDSVLLNLYGAKVCLATGEFQKGFWYIERIQQPFFFGEELVRARLLWGLLKWDDALRVYSKNMEPKAEEQFLDELKVRGLNQQIPPDPSLWMRIVKPIATPKSALELSFTPRSSATKDVQYALLGTSLFARKRWQDLFNDEFEARRSVRKREYFHAVNQYEAMGDRLLEPTLLFDLAGVYSSLNRVGDEAVIYEKINEINPDFPGLTSAMNRNQLRRRPRTGFTVNYFEKDGFDGYKDIRQWKQEVSAWYSPNPRQEGFLSASTLYYNGDKGESVSGNKFLMGVSSNVLDYFKLDMAGGVHLLGDAYPNKGIFNIGITGMAGDFLQSSLRVERQIVDDTLASLQRGITTEKYTAQATVDLFPRLHVGGSLFFANYSDSNDMSGYSFWGLFILQTQPDYLYIRAGYEFMDFQDGPGGSGELLDDGFRAGDHPYWAPVNYWRNQYTVGYKHTYSDNLIGHQIPGFLSAQYSVDYDSEGELFHYLATGIHLELSESWIFSFNGSVDFAEEYDGYSLSTTLDYRW